MKAERTGSQRWYWPAPAAMNLHRFGPSARIPTHWQDPFLAGLPRSTAPLAAPDEDSAHPAPDSQRTSLRWPAATKASFGARERVLGPKNLPGRGRGKLIVRGSR